MLDCFTSIITSFLKNYKLQDENVLVLIHRFPYSLVCGDCMPQSHVHVCEAKISICNRWELEEFY